MPTFSYSAITGAGREVSGRIDSEDAARATDQLRQRGLFPTDLGVATAAAVPPPTRRTGRWTLGRDVRAKDVAAFTRQLGTLLRAGLPLLRSLAVLGRQQRNPRFRLRLAEIATAIEAGEPLSGGMRQHPEVFDRLYLNMIRAGEASGALDLVLERLAGFQEKRLQLQGRIRAALVYPAVVLTVALGILTGLLVFVVPRFTQIFADLLKGAPLPALTRAVIATSEAVRHHLGAVGLGVVLAFAAWKLARRTARGARLLDRLALGLPLFGPLLLKSLVVRFGRTFGTLLGSGVPILIALAIAEDTCTNTRMAAAIAAVREAVKAGSSLMRPLEASGVFPPLVTSMVEVGEQTGQLPEMLAKVAEIYEEEVDQAVAGLSALLEPMLILFLALVVGIIVIALFLPIIRIVQLLT